MSRILVIDDEAALRRGLSMALEAAGFEVRLAGSGREALTAFASQAPDLILLDLGLPDMPGLEVLQRVREQSRVPVIVLSVRDQERQKVEALDLGANDYLSKPFGMQELLARIRAALRNRPDGQAPAETAFGGCRLDRARRVVSKQGATGEQEIKLTKTEFKLLNLLLRHRGQVLSHRQILDEVWGEGYTAETHYLQVYISQLRRKLEDDPTQPRLILTEPGLGYRLGDEG